MIISKIVPFQKVSVAIVQQFNFNKEMFSSLFLDEAGLTEKLVRVDNIDTAWFDDEWFRKHLFGNNTIADASGNICRYQYKAAHFEFGDEGNKKRLGISTCYDLLIDRNTKEERYISFSFDEINFWFWKNGKGYLTFNLRLNCNPNLEQKLVMQDISKFVKYFCNISQRKNDIFGGLGQDRDERTSFREILLGTSGNVSVGTEKLGVVPMLEKVFSCKNNKMDIVLNEQKEFYMVYAFCDGMVNGRMMETNDIKEFISPSEFKQMITDADFPVLCDETITDEKIGQNRQHIDNHYWSIGEKRLICVGYKDEFLKNVSSGLWKSIYQKYMIIYQYYINLYDESKIIRSGLLEDYAALYEKFNYKILNDENHGHIQDLFQNHLCRNVWNLDRFIRKAQRKIQGNNFNLEEYQKKLESDRGRNEVHLNLAYNTIEDPFVFISYAHDDFREVYNILGKMYKEGINFWYDTDLEVGKDWEEAVKPIIDSANCKGVIFFVSKTFLQHTNTLKEAEYVTKKGVDNFCINLEDNKSYIGILRDILCGISEFDIDTLPSRFNMKQIERIAYCFRESETYMRKDLVEDRLIMTIKGKEGWDV